MDFDWKYEQWYMVIQKLLSMSLQLSEKTLPKRENKGENNLCNSCHTSVTYSPSGYVYLYIVEENNDSTVTKLFKPQFFLFYFTVARMWIIRPRAL